MTVKRRTGTKFKRAVSTGAAITESKASRNMRKVKIAKNAAVRFLGKKPYNPQELYQENIALASTQNIYTQPRTYMVTAPPPNTRDQSYAAPGPAEEVVHDGRGGQGSCGFYC